MMRTFLKLSAENCPGKFGKLWEVLSLEYRIMTNVLFIFKLMTVLFFSNVNRGDLAQRFIEQNDFYQQSLQPI